MTGKWSQIVVKDVRPNGGPILIGYCGFNAKYNEWIDRNSDRLELDAPAEMLKQEVCLCLCVFLSSST